jgi:hypothetical protein
LGASFATSRGRQIRPEAIGLVVTACGIIVLASWWFVDARNLPTVAFAAVAIALSVGVAFLIERAQGIIAATPVIGSLSLIVLSWPLTTIYFAFAFPQGSYETLAGRVQFLDEAILLNVAVIVFVVGFGLGLAPFLRGKNRERFVDRGLSATQMTLVERGAALAGLAAVTGGWAGNLLLVQGNLLFVANASRNFLSGFVFVYGYRWHMLGRAKRWAVAAVLLIGALVNTIANARGLALSPIAFVVAGYLLAPTTSRKVRIVLIVAIAVILPIYAVVGNQTRMALSSIGFEDFRQRAYVLAEAVKSSNVVKEQGGFLNDSASRAFSTGGHALILAHWHKTSLADLDVPRYISESLDTVLPMFASSQPNPVSRVYTGSAILKEYGFYISDKSSVDVSIIGSLCRAGGPVLVFIGGILVGFGHVILISLLKRGMRRAWGVPFAGIALSLSLTVVNLDLIQLSRSFLWTLIYSGALLSLLFALSRLRVKAVANRIPRAHVF